VSVKAKVEIFSAIITKIFWRVLLLIGVASFAYGFGTSFPKEVREHIRFMKKDDKKKSKDDNNDK
jgi:hypothetical protein